MKGNVLTVAAILIVLMLSPVCTVMAQEADNTGGELTVPWTEFKKLLNLEESNIVIPLETFQKLLAQTGVQDLPPHSVQAGNVVISRAEFQELVNRMKPHLSTDSKPPFDFLITKASYTGALKRSNATFTGTFNVHVLKDNSYLRVPILPSSVALEDLRVDGVPALVVTEHGYHKLVLSTAGQYEITTTFSLKTSLERGPQKIDVPIQQTPITLLELDIPLTEIDIEIPQAQHVGTRLEDNNTHVSAVIAPGTVISVRWRKQVEATEKIPSKLYSELYHLISIEDDVIKTITDVNYSILHSEVDAVELRIPNGVNVLAVSGEGVGEWQEMTRSEEQILRVPFTYGKRGDVRITVTTEASLTETGVANAFSGLQTLGTVRETGFIGVELNTSAELIVTENNGLEKMPVQKLPAPLVSRSAKPLMKGFKYLKHPFSLVLDVRKHDKIAVPVATINSANAVTLFTEDGKLVNRLIYQVKNSAKQFLELQLPEDADVWSVFVGNQPVESSMNGDGKLLIPLLRSNTVNNKLNAFPVEVIYAMSEQRFAGFGQRQTILPRVDLMMSQIIWSVYLPNDFSYLYFGSTLEKEEIIRGFNVFATDSRRYDGDALKKVYKDAGEAHDTETALMDQVNQHFGNQVYESQFRNVPMERSQLSKQMEAELGFEGRMEGLALDQGFTSGGVAAGVLPIEIKIPTSGQVYRFARTIVKSDDTLEISVVHVRSWMITAAKWSLLLVLLGLVYLNRTRLLQSLRLLASQIGKLIKFIRAQEDAIRRYARAKMTPFVLAGLVLLLMPVSFGLAMVMMFLLWINIVYQFMRHRSMKAAAKTGPEASTT